MTREREPEQPFRVVVFADFVCPYSYLAVDQLARIACEYDVKPLWRPHWLHPDTPPEGTRREQTPEGMARRERLSAWVKEMAPEQFPKIRFPEKRHFSFFAFEALEFAYDRDRDFPFTTALYDLIWTEGRDIAEPGTLAAAAERAGLDPDELLGSLADREYAQRALDAVTQARDIGITNTPTIFLGRTRINGWHYYEVLQSVMEKQGMRPRAAVAAQA